MKKLLSLFLALTLVFSFCCFFVSADGEEPEAYLWLTADESFAPSIQFAIPGEKFSDADYRIITQACFEGCEGEGTAYVNYYVYSKDATGVNDFDHLIQFADFANHKTAGEGWNDLEFTFNPCTGLYGTFEGTTVDPSDIGFVTVGIGFWNATGTVKCSQVRLNKDREVVWAKSFGGKFEPESDPEIALAVLGEEGTNWGIVKPALVENGNIAREAVAEVIVGSGTYNAVLNDGAALSKAAYDNNWFAFTRIADTITDFDGAECYVGTLVYDFGEVRYWNAVRANIWDAAGGSGIATPHAIRISYSDDKENWTKAGNLVLGTPGTVYWAEGSFDAIGSRYVKAEFAWTTASESAFIMCNEVEVIGCEAPVTPVVSDFDGDVNGDGKLSSADCIYLARAILNPEGFPLTFSGDVNGDGKATVADAVYLLRHIFWPEDYPLITEPTEPEPVPAEGENIAVGKSYTTEGYIVREDGYGDPELVKLTDGVKDNDGSVAAAGFKGSKTSIIIDLGAMAQIDCILTDLQANLSWGMHDPVGFIVDFAVSADGVDYKELGSVSGDKAILVKDEGWKIRDFFVNCDVEGRYVKVTFNSDDGTETFIWPSEIEVIGTLEEGPEPAACPITVTGDEGIAAVSDEKLAKLVDGVYADGATAFADERLVGIEWQGFDYTEGAENGTKQVVLVYDLGELTDLTGVKLGAYKERNSFVDLPAVKVYLSNDGETYVRAADGAWTSPVEGLIASTDRNGEAPKGEAVYTADWSSRATLKAQYIKLVLTYTDPWAFLSEVGYTTEIAPAKVETALDANKGAPVDLVPLGGVDIAIADGTATILTAAAGAISLDSTAEGDYRLARAGVITRAKWDAEKGGYVVTENAVNPWPNNREGVMTIADNEIGVFTISSGNIDNNGAAGKWVIWHIEVGDVLYVYDDVIAINHKIDGEDSRCFVTEKTIDDIDTTGWTYVDGETQGIWQSEADPVGTYYYNAGIVDDKYVIEILFNGELTGTAESYGNGNGTNFRVWFHTAKNEAGNNQATYNSFIDVAYTPDAVLNRFMVNASETGNSASAKYGYTDEKPYVVESLISDELDAMYVKIVLDEVPNCIIDEDLDAIITVSSAPATGNNALYSGSFKTPYSGWDREQAINFYEIPDEPVREVAEPTGKNFALDGTVEIVGAAVTGDPLTAGYDKYKSALNDDIAFDEAAYTNDWFGFYYSPTADPSVCNSINGTSGDYPGNIGSAVIDLGKELTWNQVRVHAWAANASGIGAPVGINVFSSNDGETWNYEADMVLGEAGTIYWASTDTEFEAVTARYVKVDVVWTNGVFAFINEIEVYGEPEPIQPEEKVALPENAIALDRAGFEYTAGLAEVLYSAEETTIGTLTGKDLNAFAVAIVDAETMKVTWFGNTTGRLPEEGPNGKKDNIVVPANSYLFIVHMDKTADFAAFVPEIGATVTVYNVNLDVIADLKEAAALTGAGFTYENPVITIDVDTTGWTYVDGDEVGMWQNTTDPVGTYYYNTEIVDDKYVVEILFNGELNGTAGNYGNGKGTNVRLWWHTAKNAEGTDQITYNTLMDFGYCDGEILESIKTNTLADGNKAAEYTGDKFYTIEYVVPTAKDGLYVKLVFDSIPNCVINDDLDLMITVSSAPESGNNALYSGKYIKPFEKWYRTYAINFYPIIETLQPEVAVELPEGAIALDRAGFEYTAGLAEILYSAEETTIGTLTGKDLNAFAVAIVDAETMKVTWFGNTTGRLPEEGPNGKKDNIVVPANSYLFIVHMDKTADFAAFVPEIGATVTVYNVNLDYFKTLTDCETLTGAGFTYKNPRKAAEPTGINYALESTMTVVGAAVTGEPENAGYGNYKTKLNDDIMFDQGTSEAGNWFGFYYAAGALEKSNAAPGTVDGVSGNVGTLIIDLGAEKTWNQVRAHMWYNTGWGIGNATLVGVSSSADGETWEYEGDMILSEDNVYWASTDTEFEAVTSRYVKVEVLWNTGVFSMLNEVQVFGDAE